MLSVPLSLTGALLVLAAEVPPTPAPQRDLKPLLEITWSRGPNYPQGLQDSDGGILGSTLVSVGGFCSGRAEDLRIKPGIYPRGFLRKGWSLDVDAQDARWRSIPDFPGAARQALFSAVVDDVLYLWGGFSYSPPYTYADGWRLRREGGAWVWEPLPPLPWAVASAGLCVIDTTIYAFGGADYDAKAFYTETNRDGTRKRIGARLLAIDTKDLAGGWRELPSCPGTPRWVHAVQAARGAIYIIGGATGNVVRDGTSYGYCTVVDNWRYDPRAQKWGRLRDLGVSSGNFPKSSNLIFNGRYIVFPGGHQYAYVAAPDGTIRPKYGTASSARKESGLHNDVFVYDIEKDIFGTATKLPIDNNLPMSVVRGEWIYLIGGETGGGIVDGEYYGHHPELFLKGHIKTVAAARD